jgi:2,3-bisphosphoglycerate-dependent phosphoglycerate mutase
MQAGFSFDICHTSRLVRAQRSSQLVLEALQQSDMPITGDWRLNERHYGVLQEEYRSDIAKRFGRDATASWRRSYEARPPALPDNDPRWLEQCQRFHDLPPEEMPRAESMKEGVERVGGYWLECLQPALRSGNDVLVVAHTCSIRGLVKQLDNLDDLEAEAFRVPTALPIIYEFDHDLKPRLSRRLYGGVHDWSRNLRNRWKPRWMYWS